MNTRSFATFAVASALVSAVAVAETTKKSETNLTPANIDFMRNQSGSDFRVSMLKGVKVLSMAGETIGDVNDVVITPNGGVAAVIIGVGGFLGVGEKNVGVPMSAVQFSTDASGSRIAKLDATKEQLQAAPAYAGEKTALEKVQDKASDAASGAKDKAIELKDAVTKSSDR
ncbi:MAG: PRC-barrel domain-containing protein [Hyphomicrobium sp.]